MTGLMTELLNREPSSTPMKIIGVAKSRLRYTVSKPIMRRPFWAATSTGSPLAKRS